MTTPLSTGIDADQVSDECVCVWRMLDYKLHSVQ